MTILRIAACAAVLAGQTLWAASVLMISVDGLRPDAVTKADEHKLKVPNLRKFIAQGTYAEGVTGVLPTITYPSHTTMVTGVSPSVHGIYGNAKFDPLNQNFGGWYWYANEIRVPTLWQAAEKANMATASINWPVSVGAKGVRYLIPEYWRTHQPDDRLILEGFSRPPGYLEELEAKLGPFTNGNDTSLPGDELRTKYTIEILNRAKPGFMTLHLSALDETEHESSPFSADSNAALEAIDGMIGRMAEAIRKNDPTAVVAVVSDHGFVRTDHKINLLVPFIEEGFVKLGKPASTGLPTVDSWEAQPWMTGSAAIILRDPSNTQVKTRVKQMLDKLIANPDNGLARIIDQDAAKKMGGFPEATFVVEMKPGYQFAGALTGPLVTPAPSTGTHGYFPDRPEMRASFFVMGQSIAQGRNLGTIDMLQIAPTIASILGVSLPTATGKPVNVKR